MNNKSRSLAAEIRAATTHRGSCEEYAFLAPLH